jgi:hypothetical protein
MRSRGGASSSGFRAGVFGRPASAELFGLIAEMTSMRAFSESGPADRLEPSPSLRRRLRRSPGERGRRRPPSSFYDGAVAQPAKRGVRRMGQLSAFLPVRVRSMYWRETVSMIPSTACAPAFLPRWPAGSRRRGPYGQPSRRTRSASDRRRSDDTDRHNRRRGSSAFRPAPAHERLRRCVPQGWSRPP